MQPQKLGLGALLLAAAACASAQMTTWEFTYQGFNDAWSGTFLPDRKFSGLFTGRDTNGDGTIAYSELVYLSAGGRTFVDPTGPDCNSHSSGTDYQCWVSEFSYGLDGTLNFSGRAIVTSSTRYFEFWANTGQDWGFRDIQEWGGPTGEYVWADQTTLTISPAPIPEPSVALLMPAGLALLALAARRPRVKTCAVTRCN
ncbi:hypothetical protein [Pseudoduganella umbonata]|uniref:PEP-CTERM sorting domain-containing protein n=1 Tax=Pseudoduganella umbonata TaxID=864828 RepID=A0A4P8HQD6_9BURK|nr:hypothetical protein [Pseudoduganella umbonata]MBB3220497.1 hypothetical protein [Pseudoduganella umbonata]QCP11983.1 hypothetical protein FCL38_17360 [Pseudoduganella umbonata]